MKIRRATIRDARVIAEFNIKLARETEHLRLNAAVVGRGVRALLRDPSKGFYLLADQGTAARPDVAGQLMITREWSDWRNGDIWWIQSVYVRPDQRGRGIFASLFGHVKKLARRQKQVCGLRLYVEKENARAIRTYERLGMKEAYYRIFEIYFGRGKMG
jgi:ribosomal protein S18 acetylase RimI-like enzyme